MTNSIRKSSGIQLLSATNQHFKAYLNKQLKINVFSLVMIQIAHNFNQICICDRGEITALRNVLSDQTIHVLVCTSFPSRIGVCKKEMDLQIVSDLFVLSKFLAIVAFQLPAYCGFVGANQDCYLCSFMSYFHQGRYLLSLFLGKLCVAHNHSFDLQVSRGLCYCSLPLSTFKVAQVS